MTNPEKIPKINKYRSGDKVVTQFNNVHTVVSVARSRCNTTWTYTCTNYNGDTTIFDEESLRFSYPEPITLKPIPEDQLPKQCPICKSAWTRTVYGFKVWLDCPKCKLTAEEAVDRHSSEQSSYRYRNYTF